MYKQIIFVRMAPLRFNTSIFTKLQNALQHFKTKKLSNVNKNLELCWYYNPDDPSFPFEINPTGQKEHIDSVNYLKKLK